MAELRGRYPAESDIQIYRQLRADGTVDLHVSIGTRGMNRRRSYSLDTDTADRALCCIDEWERKLAESSAAPQEIQLAYCRRCSTPLSVATPGHLHRSRPACDCSADAPTDMATYVLKSESE